MRLSLIFILLIEIYSLQFTTTFYVHCFMILLLHSIHLQVCTNGLICFGRRYESYSIPKSSQFYSELLNLYCLAPYFTDIILTSSGKVWYQAYDVTSDSVSDSDDVIITMKNLVNESYAIQLQPKFIVKVTWDKVPAYGGANTEVL